MYKESKRIKQKIKQNGKMQAKKFKESNQKFPFD